MKSLTTKQILIVAGLIAAGVIVYILKKKKTGTMPAGPSQLSQEPATTGNLSQSGGTGSLSLKTGNDQTAINKPLNLDNVTVTKPSGTVPGNVQTAGSFTPVPTAVPMPALTPVLQAEPVFESIFQKSIGGVDKTKFKMA